MEIINGIERFPQTGRPLCLALGNFDGVHRGHQVIIRNTVQQARACGGVSAALIFDPHPIITLYPQRPFSLITDLADRAEVLRELGLDYLIIEQFGSDKAALSAELFIRTILVGRLKAKSIFVGTDYSFGHKGSGTAETMRAWGEKYGYSVTTTSTITRNGKKISSSIIRALVLSGEVDEAAELLDYYFFRQGKVVRGYGIGSKIVYPTANVKAGKRLIWPGKGVYLTAVGKINKTLHFGVTNVGSRPTFAHHGMSVETHILNFNGTLYNRELRLYFLEKIRETRAFPSAAILKEQIAKDIDRAQERIGSYQDAGGDLPKYIGL